MNDDCPRRRIRRPPGPSTGAVIEAAALFEGAAAQDAPDAVVIRAAALFESATALDVTDAVLIKAETILDQAFAIASTGLPVFPCNPSPDPSQSKRPLTKNGFYDATTHPDQIKAWWERWPTALIGTPTGSASGFFVVDVDAPRAWRRRWPCGMGRLDEGPLRPADPQARHGERRGPSPIRL
jgi:hypothetical protein